MGSDSVSPESRCFALIGSGTPCSRELLVFTHLAFGIIFAGAYKGFMKRRVDQVS
jgi:hypothetical protein